MTLNAHRISLVDPVFSPQTVMRRVLVIDDQQLIRECICDALGCEENLLVESACADRHIMASVLSERPFDAVILNAGMAENVVVELIAWVRGYGEKTGILIHGLGEEETDQILRYVEAGAGTFVPRDSTLEAMKSNLQGLLRGEVLCHPRLVHSAFSRLASLARTGGSDPKEKAILSLREVEVLQLVALGLRNKEICQKLYISLHTVKNHVHRILGKLEVRSRHEAVHQARRSGWI
jgi:DNA-binding NarL/FixJ family response regulator